MSLEVREFIETRGHDPFLEEYNKFIKIINERDVLGYKISIEHKKINQMHERFMHAVSIEAKKLSYRDYPPCINEEAVDNCSVKCKDENARFDFKQIKRVQCLYRLSRIAWIEQVLDMFEADDPRITGWKCEKRDKTNNKYKMHWYLRYKEKGKDFIIVFREEQDTIGNINLDFRTAYPLYLPGDKYKNDKEYMRAKKDGNEIKKPAFV